MPRGDQVATKKGKKAEEKAEEQQGPPGLKLKYQQEMVSALMKELNYTNPMQVPRLKKIVLNVSLGEALQNPKAIESATKDLSIISGQRPVVTRAKKSIAAFKLRKGMAIGIMLTLRGRMMWDFFDRLVNVSLPRIRDFRGVPQEGFDGRGNYNLGLREQVIFPEIEYSQVERLRGLQICVVTTAATNEECKRLLELLGMPFSRD